MASVKRPERIPLVRQRGGTQPLPLSLDEVMDASMAITERAGLGALTIKAVADELGVTSPAVYHYVDGKQALIDRLCERVTKRIDLSVDPSQPWQDQVVVIIIRMHHAYAHYPGLGTRALAIPGQFPAGARIAETLRDVVIAAGFAKRTANEVVAALHLLFSGWLVGKLPPSSPPLKMTTDLLERTTRRLLAGYSSADGRTR